MLLFQIEHLTVASAKLRNLFAQQRNKTIGRMCCTVAGSDFSFTKKDRLTNGSRHAATVQHQHYPSSSNFPRETKTLAMTRGMTQLQESDIMT